MRTRRCVRTFKRIDAFAHYPNGRTLRRVRTYGRTLRRVRTYGRTLRRVRMCERSDAFAHSQMDERSDAFAHMDERSDAFACANAPTRSHISKWTNAPTRSPPRTSLSTCVWCNENTFVQKITVKHPTKAFLYLYLTVN